MISVSYMVTGDERGFDWNELMSQRAQMEKEHNLIKMVSMSASRVYDRPYWRVTIRYNY